MDPSVVEFLSRHGWTPDRCAADRVAAWREAFFSPEGFLLSEPARRLLLSFGGLRFSQSGPGESVARASFHFDPTAATGEADRFRAFESVLGARLCPVGEADDGYTYLAVAEDGRLVCLMDDAWVLGATLEEGLTALVRGRRGEIHHGEPR